MDFIGKLPHEISLHILSFLPPSELVKCFLVSKTWYNLTNSDCLWRRHCLQIKGKKINCDKDSLIHRPASLCKWAIAYRTFIRKINRWENDLAQDFNIQLRSGNCVLAFGHLTAAVYYFSPVDATLEKIDFYQLHEDDVKLEETVDLELPGRGVVQLMKNDIYTLVSRENFILCLKKIGERHVSYLAICVKGSNIEHATDNFEIFFNTKRLSDRELNIQKLCDEYAWIEDNYNVFHVFDLENHTCERIQAMQKLKTMNGMVAVWSHSTLNIYSSRGEILQSLLVDLVYDVYLSKNIVASLHIDTGCQTRLLQTFDLKTGKNLMRKGVMRFTDITLHYDYDCLYALERTSRDLYRVSSLCAKSGRTQWSISQPNMFYNMWPAVIHAVSYKHLFVWPSNNSTDKYSVFNCKTGKHLYASSKISGHIQSVSEDVCVSIESSILHFKSFI